MATWDPAAPALADDIANDLGKIRDNFTVIGNAWSGDHEALAGDGNSSTFHKKVDLKKLAIEPILIADHGTLYTFDVGGIAELKYIDSSGNKTQLTSAGNAVGVAKAFAYVNGNEDSGVNPKTLTLLNSSGITSFERTALGHYTVSFPAFVDTNYVVNITYNTPTTTLRHFWVMNSLVKTTAFFTFRLEQFVINTATWSDVNSDDINIVVFRA